MLRRPIFWIVAVLLCALGAWCVWQLGHRPGARPPAQMAAPAGSVTPAISSQSPPRASTNAAPASPLVSLRERIERCRLSNTAEPLKTLIQRDSALLLENARWDTTKPLDLNIPAHLRSQGDPGTYIVKADGHIDDNFRELLRRAGLSLVSYIPHDAWLVRGSEAHVAAVTGQPGVRAVVPFEPYFKLQSGLLPLAVDQEAIPAGTYLNLVLFADARAETMRALSSLGASVLAEGPSPFGPVVTVHARPESLVAMAQLPGVQHIEWSAARVPVNDLARVTVGVSANTTTTNNYFGLTGTNVLVAITDSGVDITHPDLIGRVFTNSLLSGIDTGGHGTHVAGIIAGDGTASTTVTNPPSGSLAGANYRGKAPGAKLYSMKLGESPVADLGFDAYVQQQAANTNALISNNSWGQGGVFDYNITAASYDAAARDALPFQEGSQPVLFVFGAGNDGGGADNGLSGIAGSVLSPATGKNVISVGSLEQLRNITNEVVIAGSTNAVWAGETDSDTEVAAYSARGNVGIGVEGEFGRVKPDVVAPGTFTVSARSAQWDEVAYYNITNYQTQVIDEQTVAAGQLHQYSIFVPPPAIGLSITVTPLDLSTNNSQTNLPIYVSATTLATNSDPVRTNVFLIPPDMPLTPGSGYFYAVGNPYPNTVGYSIRTVITVTNQLEDYFRVLKALNDALGGAYRYESGTSMAAPAVSGVLALMQEFYASKLARTNSPALMKAMLINGARSASSIYDLQVNNTVNHQGWGLVNLPTSLPPTTNALATNAPSSFMFFDQNPTNALATGQSQTRSLALNNNSQTRPLRVTLVWTDPPGNPAAGVKLVNDLDLVVTNIDTGEVYFGNDIPVASDFNAIADSNAPPALDLINNVENVFISEPFGTNFTITVRGRRVNVNAVTAHTNDVVQDYALVISSGNGEVTNSFTLAEAPIVTNTIPYVTVVTNTATTVPLPLFNQTVGANAPLLSGLNGMTNQWHFYVVTNYGTNANFTNAAFITFLPPTLATPRMGPRSDVRDEHSRPEADIDMYVSTNAALTNLNPAAIAGADRSVGRGGTETIVYSNSAPGLVYYVGIKSEDQMAGQYAFFSIFSDEPFSTKDSEGNLFLRGVPVPAVIPDGTPSKPGTALIFGIATEQIKVRRVIVTNIMTHENFGDLFGNLSHNNSFSVLHNHTFGDGFPTQLFVYDDSDQGDLPGSKKSDGPGSLQNFVGQEGIGQWMLTMLDDAPASTGQVDRLTIKIEPQDLEGNGDTLTIRAGGWGYDFIEVPAGATNLMVGLSGNTLPVELYVRRGDFPDFNNYDKKTTVLPNVYPSKESTNALSVTKFDLPPLQPGIYYIGVFNPNAIAQTVTLRAHIDIDLSGIVPTVFSSLYPLPLLDDAVTIGEIDVTSTQRVVSVEVGVAIQHPRVSDLALQLVSPKGKRVLLFENRGYTDTNGLGTRLVVPQVTTNVLATVLDNGFESFPPTFGLGAGSDFLGWHVDTGDIDVCSDGAGFFGPSHTGINNLDINGFTSGAISTNFITQSNAFYLLSFAYTKNPGGPFGYVPTADVKLGGTNVCSVSASAANTVSNLNWQTTSVVYQASGPITKLELVSTYPGVSGVFFDTIHIDRVEITSNFWQHFTFTEDTNKNPTLLKFTLPPFGGGVGVSNVLSSGFEGVAAGYYTAPTAGVPDGWNVTANMVNVTTNTPHTGTNALALQLGTISRTVPTIPGHRYVLSYAYRNGNLNPTHWWPGNSNTTDIIAGDNGVFTGGASYTNPGEVAQAFKFNNTNFMTVGSMFPFHTTNASTFEWWMKPPAVLKFPYETIFWTKTATGPDNNRFNFYLHTTLGFNMDYRDAGFNLHPIINAVPIALNTWTHMAITKSGNTYTVYTNGVLAVAANDVGPNLPTSVGWRFSGQMTGSHEYNGNLDEVATFDRVLTPEEIRAIYLAGAAGKCGTPTPPTICGMPMAQVILSGISTNLFTAPNSGWLVTNQTFTATAANTALQFQGLASGVFLDTIQVVDQGTAPYVFPEETLTAFKGDVAKGIWKLEVWDSRVGATNPAPELSSWALSFLFENNEALPIVLQHDVAVTNSIPPGQMQILVVDVPPWATAATNSLLFATNFPLLVWFNQTAVPTGAAPPDFQFYGGAVTNGVQTLVTNGAPPLLPGQRYYLGIQNTNAATVTYGFRVDFDITPLTNAMPYTAITTSNGIPRYFTYTVSSNATAVAFDLYGMDGNLNLVARQGAPLPTQFSGGYDYGSFNAGVTDEQILVLTNSAPVALRPGVWYLGVFNTTANAVNYTIRATEFTNAIPTIITLTNAIAYTVFTNDAAPGSMEFYRYVVTPPAARVQFETFGADGDFNIVARRGLPLPDLTSFDYLSANGGTNDELIVVLTNSAPVVLTPGDWFITAVKISTGPATYNIMATEWNQTGQPIVITNIDVSTGAFCITWNSLPGVHYVVQSTPVINPPAWVDASATITAVDFTTTWCTPITGTMSYFQVVEGISQAPVVPVPVNIDSVQVMPGGIVLTWFGPAGSTFHVEWTDSLTLPIVWNQVATPVTSATGIFTFTDDGSQTAPLGPTRFYRLNAP